MQLDSDRPSPAKVAVNERSLADRVLDASNTSTDGGRGLRFCRTVAVIMQCKILLNFWAVPVLFLNTVVSTLYISNDTKNLTTHGRALSCRLALGLLVRNSSAENF